MFCSVQNVLRFSAAIVEVVNSLYLILFKNVASLLVSKSYQTNLSKKAGQLISKHNVRALYPFFNNNNFTRWSKQNLHTVI